MTPGRKGVRGRRGFLQDRLVADFTQCLNDAADRGKLATLEAFLEMQGYSDCNSRGGCMLVCGGGGVPSSQCTLCPARHMPRLHLL